MLICDTMTMMQVTLINMLLRNYLHYNLYDQAEEFEVKGTKISITLKSPGVDFASGIVISSCGSLVEKTEGEKGICFCFKWSRP